MDYRFALFVCLAVFLSFLVAHTEGRTKKVVIHVPYKVKKLKHTHTVYKTVHHHHTHHEVDHGPTTEEHEHFHHFHIHDEPQIGQHSQPIGGIGIPDFLPDTPLEIEDLPKIRPNELSRNPPRLVIPPYKRHFRKLDKHADGHLMISETFAQGHSQYLNRWRTWVRNEVALDGSHGPPIFPIAVFPKIVDLTFLNSRIGEVCCGSEY